MDWLTLNTKHSPVLDIVLIDDKANYFQVPWHNGGSFKYLDTLVVDPIFYFSDQRQSKLLLAF